MSRTTLGPEAKIERAACVQATARGWYTLKFTSPTKRSVPDRIFFRNGRTVLIEFKSPKGVLTPGQEREISRLQAQRIPVAVCRSVEEALAFLEANS